MQFKVPKGVDKVPITIRVDETDFKVIDKLSKSSRKSYNFIINQMVKFAIENMNMEDIKDIKGIED